MSPEIGTVISSSVSTLTLLEMLSPSEIGIASSTDSLMASITSSQTRDSRLQLRKNGSEIANHISSPATNNWASSHSIFMIVNANVGDYFEVYGQQSSGDSGRYAYGAKQYTYFKGYRLP